MKTELLLGVLIGIATGFGGNALAQTQGNPTLDKIQSGSTITFNQDYQAPPTCEALAKKNNVDPNTVCRPVSSHAIYLTKSCQLFGFQNDVVIPTGTVLVVDHVNVEGEVYPFFPPFKPHFYEIVMKDGTEFVCKSPWEFSTSLSRDVQTPWGISTVSDLLREGNSLISVTLH